MSQPITEQKTVYVSYSYADSEWKERILAELSSYDQPIQWEFWDDSRIEPGDLWLERIKDSLEKASAALLILSPAFLESDFINNVEFPYLIELAQSRGLRVFPILARRCNWRSIKFITERQILPRGAMPLEGRSESEIDTEIKNIAKQITSALKSLKSPNKIRRTSAPEQQSSSREIAEEFPSSTFLEPPAGDFEEPDSLPVKEARDFDLSPTARYVMNRAIRMLTIDEKQHRLLTTSFLLFAMVDEGIETQINYGTVSFLSDFFSNSAHQETYLQVRNRYFKENNIPLDSPPSSTASALPVSPAMTVACFNTLKKAEIISQQITGNKQISIRHLLAALINQADAGEEAGLKTRLDEMGIPLSHLRDEFLSYLKKVERGNIEKWERILSGQKNRAKRNSRFSGYDSDDTRGEEDWLNIDDDVNAFAALIASRTIMPPLSIGLFGEWGSGKTFFMRRLRKRIDTLSRIARNSEKMQKDVPYYKRIAQIEFNAWHYVEGNLWASLVEHIFKNLRVADEENEDVISNLQQHLLSKLNIERIAAQQASDKVDSAKQELSDTETKLNEAKRHLDENSRKLQTVRATDVFATIDLSDPALRGKIDGLLEDLKMPPVSDAAQSLLNKFNEAKALVERGNNLLTPLITAKDKGRRLIWLIVCLAAAPAIGLLLVMIRRYSQAEWISESVAVLTGFTTLLLATAAWIQRQASWVSNWLGRAEQAKQQIDAKIAESEAELRKNITELEKEIAVSKAQYESALREKEAAAQRVAKAEAELKEATSEKLLAKFIQDRAASDDYRKHLGVLAVIRDDFEKLSDYIETQNRRLTEIDADQEAKDAASRKFATLDEEKVEQDMRINRIVLYIDDLDRCPPNKVVDVLQAVHLLLAFPLFVVVVGVDARWITRSLETRYKELLHNSTSDGVDKTSLIGAAKPDDYLEKIFQIPFWLSPMDRDACEKMVNGLLKNNLAKSSPAAANITSTGNGDGQIHSQHKKPVGEIPQNLRQTTGGIITQTQMQEIKPVSEETQSLRTGVSSETINSARETLDNLLNQQQLQILDEEQDFISELSTLLGRSPRALKRFVNIYRLIKAGLSEDELNSFQIEEDGIRDFEAILFLLAVDTGLPAVSEDLFGYFQKIYDGSLKIPPNTGILSTDWLSSTGIKNASFSDWRRIELWLANRMWTDTNQAKRIGKWIPRVSRYSFQPQRKM
ncbi:MAG: P-loop NTPase fold protein [Acidobacteriota bacterium]|nr:P-loop NTPase fold protein [Acidobacteriota bacterium]